MKEVKFIILQKSINNKFYISSGTVQPVLELDLEEELVAA